MAFAGKLGSAGARMGKKAAQSEAGRRATKAAIKGACDGVRDDMISRYSESDTTPTPTTPSAKSLGEKKEDTSSQSKEEKANTVPSWVDDDEDEEVFSGSSSRKPPSHHSNPPKPSLMDKFKISINKKSSGSSKPASRPIRKNPKDRVYSHRLAKLPDWDKLPRAQALYNYKGQMKCDLEFRKGQVIQVITRTDTQNDWWEGKLEDRVGIFPANYVKLLF